MIKIYCVRLVVKKMPVFTSSRKVQQFGSSLATTLPSMFVKANEIEKGVEVFVIYNLEGVLVMCKSVDITDIPKCLNNIVEKLKDESS